ncbi:pyridoxal-phosphate-dependent aminotransferase family protein [Desulfurobacterium atlanticum]|uniref:Aspartate aminotransferase n=1 Tax=Desulfurobacterium atlanticum TaxID=240169 RepID=A0A238ZDE0_9BACT|nr:alanine--glyoxylate aminotransferase family protein [Desulfurobacterium atlanticum]SNR81545.1 aspartate aminotransferase [Desulfurobacterium atlanticum]
MKPLKERLMTPGPTPVPERVLQAMASHTMYHRSPKFKEIFAETIERLKRLFKTERDTLILTSSGTGAMEAAVSNLFSPGDSAVVIVGGKFGQRWKELCETFGVNPVVIELEWGKSVNPEDVKKKIEENRNIKGVLVQICETSTGAFNDVKALGEITARYDNVILVADGITAFGVYDIPVDDWNIDVAITGSQKALMTPPGLAVISLSEKAKSRLSRKKWAYYFDLSKEIKNQAKGQTAYTPAVNLIVGLNEALKMIEEEGLENVAKRHEILAKSARAGIKALELELLPEHPANGVTAVKLPEHIDGQKFVSWIRDRLGIVIAGGQEHLKGKIFRLSHMGYIDIFDLLTQLEAVEFALTRMEMYPAYGKAVAAAMETYIELVHQSPIKYRGER